MPSSALMENWLECPDCAAPCRAQALRNGETLACGRCGATVQRGPGGAPAQTAFAFATAGLMTWALANVLPIMTFSIAGNAQSNHMITGVIVLTQSGYGGVALMVLFCGVIAPAAYLAAVTLVTGAWMFGRGHTWADRVERFAEMIEPWSLVLVFFAACYVAVVKLETLGEVSWDHGAIAVLALAVFGAAASGAFRRASLEHQEASRQ